MKVAVYGSLKKGAYNHDRFGLKDPIGHDTVFGSMFLEHSYPRLYDIGVIEDEGGYKEYPVEIYDLDDETFNQIDGMESASGYYKENRMFGEHEAVVFFSVATSGSKSTWLEDYNEVTVKHAYVNN